MSTCCDGADPRWRRPTRGRRAPPPTPRSTSHSSRHAQRERRAHLDLQVLAPDGTQVASSQNLGSGAENVDWDIAGVPYPGTRTYTMVISNKGLPTPSYRLLGTKPDMATVDLRLENTSGGVLANSTLTSGQALRTLRYNAPAGTYVLRASSADLAAAATLHEDHLQLDYA